MSTLRVDPKNCLIQAFSEESRSPEGLGEEVVKQQESSEEDGQQVFERTIAKLKLHVGAEAYASWFGRLKLDEYMGNQVRLSVPTAFLRSWINNHYLALLFDIWKEENPEILRIDIVVRSVNRLLRKTVAETGDLELLEGKRIRSEKYLKTSVFGSPLDPHYIFDNFVEGASNRVALAAARAISEASVGALRFNPLFIHASVGLGKTHLLQAIATAVLSKSSPARVVYLTAEYFMWRFATALRDNDVLSFKEQLRDIDFLIIDDMQFLQGRFMQHEFCHLLNSLLDSAKQVVVAADRSPGELDSLDLRVRSRLQCGVSLEISHPDYEMRLEMLRSRLKSSSQDSVSFRITDEVLSHVARIVSGSGRDIEGALNQLLFRQSFETNFSMNRIDELLGHLRYSRGQKRVPIEEIQRVVARHYSVSKEDLLSNRRVRVIVRPRQIAMYLAKMMTSRSLPEIGRRFGGRDHTTVLHAIRKIGNMMITDPKFSQELDLLKCLIKDKEL
ncbi:MAG: chromosomal replication initiator protein [Candidatus Tokpelaia sp. JSC161]|jgi:chromosomal replication initiator protein|nr:MAG: chromosomal replication initiator protein [Candidatus Tokpelaia sp. JSC161]